MIGLKLRELSTKIHELEKKIAIAPKNVCKCDGISSRQHNKHIP